jgi:hypothetical protein
LSDFPSEEELRAASPIYDVVRTFLSDPEYLRHINANAPLEVVLRGHLWLERELAAIVRLAVVEPNYLNVDRMSFSLKLSLCAAQMALPPGCYEPVRELNKLRNRVAHDAAYEVGEDDEQRLLNSMPEVSRMELVRLRNLIEHREFPATLRFTISYLLGQFVFLRTMLERSRTPEDKSSKPTPEERNEP